MLRRSRSASRALVIEEGFGFWGRPGVGDWVRGVPRLDRGVSVLDSRGELEALV